MPIRFDVIRWLRDHKTPVLIGSGILVLGGLLLARGGRRRASLTRFPGWTVDPRARCGIACSGPCREAFIEQVHAAYLAAGAPEPMATFLTAHSGLAVGFGRCLWNHNMGVIRATPGWIAAGKPWIIRSTIEAGVSGEHFVDAGAKWRVYDSLADSAADVLRLLSTRSRYRTAWALLQAGDVNWFAELGRAGYYTEPVADHFPRYAAAYAETQRRLA